MVLSFKKLDLDLSFFMEFYKFYVNLNDLIINKFGIKFNYKIFYHHIEKKNDFILFFEIK